MRLIDSRYSRPIFVKVTFKKVLDYCPSQAFCFKNHHWPDQEIYNFKQAGGHKSFLLNSGNYLENYSYIRTSNDYQKIETKRPDAMTWSDSILTKLENPLHPLADL